MSQTFPGAIPNYPDTTGAEFLGNAGGGIGVSRIFDDYGLDITGLATKMGSGADTPATGQVLRASGTGTSEWGAVVLTTDVTGTLPVANGGTGITALGSGVATFLGTPSSANLATAVTDETGTGALVFGTSPTIATPTLTTPTIASFANANHDHTNGAGGGSLGANTVGNTQVIAGVPVQVVATNFSAVATGTTALPYDDSIPQNTEGTEFMTRAITPKSTTNRLFIEVNLVVSHTVIQELVAALFQDTTANALAAVTEYGSTATGEVNLHLTHDMVAGTTSSTTFKVRAGGPTGSTMTFNGRAGTRIFGAITKSTMKITEYKAN